MASKFFINSGNYNDNANWSTSSGGVNDTTAPTSSDDVFLDGSSGTCTIAATGACRSINCTGYTGTLTRNTTINFNIGDATAGASNNALIFSAGMTYVPNFSTGGINFISTSTTVQNVNFTGKTTGNVTYNGVGGSWKLTGSHITNSTSTVTLTRGIFDTNSQVCNWGLFNSSNSNIRSLLLGSSDITITSNSPANSGVWDLNTTTNLTFNAGTSTITLNGGVGGDSRFRSGGVTYNNVVLEVNGTIIIVTGATYTNLSIIGSDSPFNEVVPNNNFITVTGVLTLTGFSRSNRLLLRSAAQGTQRKFIITGATVTASNVDFRDIDFNIATNLSAISGGSGDCNGNTGITFTSASNKYWVGNGGNWSDSTNHWAISSGGSPGVDNIPLAQDNVFFDSNSFSLGSQTVTSDVRRVGKSINWTGATNTPTVSISVARVIYGSLTLISGMNYIGGDGTTFRGRDSFTLTSAGRSFSSPIIEMFGGTLTLQDNFTATGTLTLSEGIFTSNNFNVTVANFSSPSTANRTLNMGSGTWTLTGVNLIWTMNATVNFVLNANTSTIIITDTSSTDKRFNSSGTRIYYNLNIESESIGNIRIQGSNTFNDINIDSRSGGDVRFEESNTINILTISSPNIVKFASSVTQNLSSLIANGSASNIISLSALTSGVPATLSDTSGTNILFFCSLTDIIVTGGAIWEVFNSINVSGNSGFIFKNAVSFNKFTRQVEFIKNLGGNIFFDRLSGQMKIFKN